MDWSTRRARYERLFRRWQPWLALLPAVVALVHHTIHARRFILRSSFKIEGVRYYSLFDDGMISMRYAWNLAHGHGLVWNPGERVEGYTNLLWTLVMSVFAGIFDQSRAVLAVQILGAVLLGASALVFARTAGRQLAHRHWIVVALVEGAVVYAITTLYPLRFWSHMGMEVSALLFVNALAWWFALGARSPRTSWIVGALLAVAYAIRPDGFLPLLPALALVLFESRASARRVFTSLAPLVGTVLAVQVWRMGYYAADVPNTYLLKMGSFPLRFRLAQGWSFVTPYLWQTLPMWLAAIYVVIRRRNARVLALLASACSMVAYQIYVGGDPWPYWRQMAPAYPLFVLFIVEAADDLLELPAYVVARLLGWQLRPAIGTALSLLLPLLAHGLMNLAERPTATAFKGSEAFKFNVEWNKANVKRGLLLERILQDQGRIAVIWAGATPYYCPSCFAIDLLGKCDAHVARQQPDLSGLIAWSGMTSVPGHNKSDVEYSVSERDADYVETLDWGSDEATPETKKQFEGFNIRGQTFALRKGSPRVRWDYVTREKK